MMSSMRQVLGGVLRFRVFSALANTTSNSAGCVGSFLQARSSHNIRPKLYPKEHVVTLIPGDGVWPELIAYVREVMERCGAPVRFEEVPISELRKSQIQGATLEDALASLKRNRVCLKGILRSPVSFRASELESMNMKLRRQADLFAHVVHIRSLPGVSTRHGEDLDFYIIRDQVEGSYSVLEHETVPGIVESLKVVTRANSERIAKFAFDLATKFNRKRVTAVHKANIMKLTDGLFLESCARVAKLYPFIKFDSMIIDNCCMQLVARPRQFDVLVMGNLYGNIIDNLAAGLVGGAGVVPGASYSHDLAVFETGARHPFATAVGRNIANPTAILLSAADMLRHLNAPVHADCIERAVKSVIQKGLVRTQDLGGYATTSDFVHAVIDKLDMA